MEKVLTHPAPHQRTRDSIDCTVISRHRSQRWPNIKSYDARML